MAELQRRAVLMRSAAMLIYVADLVVLASLAVHLAVHVLRYSMWQLHQDIIQTAAEKLPIPTKATADTLTGAEWL